MYDYPLHQQINNYLKNQTEIAGEDNLFYTRFLANLSAIHTLYHDLYRQHPKGPQKFQELVDTIISGYKNRPVPLREKDFQKAQQGQWFLSNQITGMSLYVDRFCGDLETLADKLDHFEKLGVNLLHLMPLFESPELESDGGYAVSNFRKIDARFGTLQDLQELQRQLMEKKMFLMTDIVLNHTSHLHAWARKAKAGDTHYQDYFYFFDDRTLPDEYDRSMPEIFPESAPGNFSYVAECNKWVMTVFHKYQWDLNYTNPQVLIEMLDIVFFYANLGVDILRIDAPAFVWKRPGTASQNLPEAHTILRLLKQCVQVASPGMALLGEAIVAPAEIMKYFGTGYYRAHECDFAYNATQMALQWDALATGDTRIMLAAQPELMLKPEGTSWITYTRCHDDIGLGYDDSMIVQAGFQPCAHREFLKNYYAGLLPDSPARGALFAYNPKTGDARISGSLASLCGLEKALEQNDIAGIDLSIQKMLLMQAMSFFIGGVPMLFYGDEAAFTNDYGYLDIPGKSYDNRWMHRPLIDWKKMEKIDESGTVENQVFSCLKKLISIRKKLPMLSDHSNITWMNTRSAETAGFVRTWQAKNFYGFFNFSGRTIELPVSTIPGDTPLTRYYDHWRGQTIYVATGDEKLVLAPYDFYLLEAE